MTGSSLDAAPRGHRCSGRVAWAAAAAALFLAGCGDFTLWPGDKVLPEAVLDVDETSVKACQTESVTVDGSRSSDPGAAEGDVLKFQWTLAKPAESEAAFADAEAARTSFSPDRPGDYGILLTVTTARETSASATATVQALAGPVAVLVAPAQAELDTPVSLDGGSSKNPLNRDCGSLGLLFGWELTSMPEGSTAVVGPAGSDKPTFTPDVPGDYQVRLTVTTDQGEDAATRTVTVPEGEPEEPEAPEEPEGT